jgi:hypothetical protein
VGSKIKNCGLIILLGVDEFVGKPRLFEKPECKNCVFKGGSYCWNQWAYYIWRGG